MGTNTPIAAAVHLLPFITLYLHRNDVQVIPGIAAATPTVLVSLKWEPMHSDDCGQQTHDHQHSDALKGHHHVLGGAELIFVSSAYSLCVRWSGGCPHKNTNEFQL